MMVSTDFFANRKLAALISCQKKSKDTVTFAVAFVANEQLSVLKPIDGRQRITFSA
jgi:hypothetical protein